MTTPRTLGAAAVLAVAALAGGLLAAPALAEDPPAAPAQELPIDSATFGGLRARALGPATMSGRIAAIDGVAAEPSTLYVGAASGGVWRSKDGGTTFSPVFDEHTQSIGAIRVDPSDPKTIWVGTGESWTRNSTSIGTGVYKSTDGGDSWQAVGLAASERIARIQVDPAAGDVVYVCATGHLWDDHEERGVFKTIDGGKHWEKVLYVDARTGCSDLAMDPQDSLILYAGMWQFRRYPDFFASGGPGSALYKTTDGGKTWRRLEEGLPAGEKGRIAVAVAPSRPNRLYAVVEADETALYRSDDLGERWTRVNDSFNVGARPFYFAYVVVDPTDHNRVYKPGLFLGISTDGGTSFTSLFSGFAGGVHGDHHALWINPRNPHELALGTDGGVYLSEDRGGRFRIARSLPVSQFYEVSYDLERPYNVYGGLQDNGTWTGPSRGVGGVFNKDWKNIGFGDGFHAYRDLADPDLVYVEYQGGRLMRFNLATDELKAIAPLPGEGEEDYRFNWNTALALSPGRPGTIYYGGQVLFRSADRGESWEKISPDLTTDDPRRQRQKQSGGLTIDNSTAENNATIFTISESPQDGDVIWVGTDDGLVQVTRDGGKSWENVTPHIPGVPPGTWVSHLEASPHDPAGAFVSFDGHRTGDFAPYLFRTNDLGATWEAIAGGVEGYAHVVKQDLVNPDLLFAGTELGLWISLDGGRRWARFKGGMPEKVPVYDLDVHPREHDLIVATHGRGIYILDDITPLRALTAAALAAKLVLLPARDATMPLAATVQDFPGDDEFVGANPAEAASIFYYQDRRHIFGDMKIEIYDGKGELVSTVPAGKVKGMNRADWPMRLPPPKMPPATTLAPAFVGPRVPEGTYTFKLTKGKETFAGQVRLVPDPRGAHTAEDRRIQQETAVALYRLLERLTYVVDATIDLKEQASVRSKEGKAGKPLAARLDAYAAELESFRGSLVSTAKAGWISGDEKLREKTANVYAAVSGYDGRPTRSQLDRTRVLESQLVEAESRFAELAAASRLGGLNSQLAARGLAPLAPLAREEWKKRQEEGRAGGAASAPLAAGALARLAMGVRVPVLGR